MDAFVAVLMLFFGLIHLIGAHVVRLRRFEPMNFRAPLWVLAILLVGATLPVAIRRIHPRGVLAVVTVFLVTSTILGASFAPDPIIALPLYMVAVTEERQSSLMALAVVELALIVSLAASQAFRPAGGDITFNIVLAAAAWFAGDSIRNRRAYAAGLAQQAAERRRKDHEHAQRTAAEERLRFARELHDVLAHSLSVIAVQSGVGRHVIESQPEEAAKALAAVELTSRSALQDLRRVLGVLREPGPGTGPSLSPSPGISDLTALVSQVESAGIPVQLSVQSDLPRLTESLQLSVYRIVQEALTNVVKHAPGAPTKVDVRHEDDAVLVDVTNEASRVGDGGLSETRVAGEGHGIAGMRERTSLFKGTLEAGPLPGGRFRVLARLPLDGRTT